MRILVVEDNAIIGSDIAAMLGDWGYDAIGPIGSVEEALTEIAVCRPDAAILDVMLQGGITSEKIAAALRENGIPFIGLTGVGHTRFQSLPGFNGIRYLEKPVETRALRYEVDGLLGEGTGRSAS